MSLLSGWKRSGWIPEQIRQRGHSQAHDRLLSIQDLGVGAKNRISRLPLPCCTTGTNAQICGTRFCLRDEQKYMGWAFFYTRMVDVTP